MGENDRTRIGDAEREAAIMRLSEAHALGQLDLDEFNERTASASAAKTAGDLSTLLADLPGGQDLARPSRSPSPAYSRAGTSAQAGREELQRRAAEGDEDAQRRVAMAALSTWVFVAFITTAVWLATGFGGGDGGFWPIWPMIGLGIPLVAALARWKIK